MRTVTGLTLGAMVAAGAATTAAGEDPAAQARLDWLLDHQVEIRSIDPADRDFSDLEPIAAAIGDARVVQLGEQSHGDGAVFLAKTRLIAFLHERHGFDVLAFESGLFDCSIAEARFAAAGAKGTPADALAAAEQGVFAIWTRSEQCRPLFDYVLETRATPRPLEVAGFDCQFTALASAGYVDALAAAAKELGIALADEEQARLVRLYEQIRGQSSGQPFRGPVEKADDAAPFFEEVERRFTPADDTAADARRRRFLARTLRNFRIQTKVSELFAGARNGDDRQREASNLRDRAMGENVVWLANEWFPGRKILVWAASMHIAHGLPAVRGVGAPASVYEKYLVQGDVVHRDLGDDAYTILFTAARGASGSVFETRETPLLAPMPDSLEDLFDRAGATYAFVDFRAARAVADSPWSSRMIARPFGYGVMEGDWTKVADAFVFTAEMTPSRPRRALER